MKINHARLSVPGLPKRPLLVIGGACGLLLAGCVSERAPPPPRLAPRPAPVALPTVQPQPVTREPADWRDRPLTTGDWSYRMLASGSVARFSDGAGNGLVAIACNTGQHVVTVTRSVANPTEPQIAPARQFLPLTLVTTVRSHAFNAALSADAGAFGPGAAVSLNPSDPTLDDLAFSRGRFAIEASGQPTLILPAWEEVGRVVEDCR